MIVKRKLSSSEYLLRAALLAGEQARAAWQAWQGRVDIERLPPGQYGLLPALYRNLEALGVTAHPWLPRLKGVYRREWVAAQRARRQLEAALETLAAAGLRPVALGDAAAAAYYPGPGWRPIYQLELAVAEAEWAEAARLLEARGWQAGAAAGATHASPLPQAACVFRQAEGPPLHLRWRWLGELPCAAVDEALRAGVVDRDGRWYAGADALLLRAALAAPALLALADGAVLLRSGQVNWEALPPLARAWGAASELSALLSTLEQALEISAPPGARAALGPAPSAPPGLPGKALRHWRRWRRLARCLGRRPTPASLVDYLRRGRGA